MLRIADKEEDGWEVIKCYLSDDLASDSEDEKHFSRARREANKQKDKKKQFRNAPLSEKNLKSLTNHTKDTEALRVTQNLKKSVLPVDKKGTFNIFAQIEETETTVNLDRDWEISGKTEEISVRGRLKENGHFWKKWIKTSFICTKYNW